VAQPIFRRICICDKAPGRNRRGRCCSSPVELLSSVLTRWVITKSYSTKIDMVYSDYKTKNKIIVHVYIVKRREHKNCRYGRQQATGEADAMTTSLSFRARRPVWERNDEAISYL